MDGETESFSASSRWVMPSLFLADFIVFFNKFFESCHSKITAGSSGTGYDKIQYEVNAIDTVIGRLDEGVYPRKSWRII